MHKAIQTICTVLSVLLAITIFILSDQPGDESTQLSQWAVEVLQLFGFPISLEDVFIVLKVAHFTEYFMLYWIVYFSHFNRFTDNWKRIWAPVLICALYASSDEYHQSFVPGRYSSVWDVCVDTLGALFSAVCVRIFLYFKIKRKKN